MARLLDRVRHDLTVDLRRREQQAIAIKQELARGVVAILVLEPRHLGGVFPQGKLAKGSTNARRGNGARWPSAPTDTRCQ